MENVEKGWRDGVEVMEEGVNAAAVSQSVSQWFGEEANTKGVDVCGSFQGWCFVCVCIGNVYVCVGGGNYPFLRGSLGG